MHQNLEPQGNEALRSRAQQTLSSRVSDEQALRQLAEQAFSRGLEHIESQQQAEGCLLGEVQWCPVLTAQYVLTVHMTGGVVPPDRAARFIEHFVRWQNADGGWGMHAESPSYLFVSTLVYVALRILGQGPEAPLCRAARGFIDAQGGALRIPTWGKLWLAMMGLYEWSGVAPMPPELWTLPPSSPMYPGRMYCHTRLIYLGMSYLYAARFTAAGSELVDALRRELYAGSYFSVPFEAHRFDVAPCDVFEQPSRALRRLYGAGLLYERVQRRWLRRRAMAKVLERIVAHQRESRAAAISPVNGLLNTLALFHAGHADWAQSLEGANYWSWCDEEGERFNGAHSHTWDTAFAVQALSSGPASTRSRAFLGRAAQYLRAAQVHGEAKEADRDVRDGGFCFSDAHHQWPVSDCTGEALAAAAALARQGFDSLDEDGIRRACRFVLSRQNADGGWGSYERRRGGALFDRFNPSEMFGNCMTERSYVECTASCICGLIDAESSFGHAWEPRLRRDVAKAVREGTRFLRRTQRADGSWEGFWGVNYTYGTLFGVSGLLASGARADDAAIKAACRWLMSVRLPDGGWGESWRSCVEGRYLPHARSQVIMTAWALMTMLRARYDEAGAQRAIAQGIGLLVERQGSDGAWPKEGVAGTFFATAMHHYCAYKDYFSLWAIGLFLSRHEG
ncbi:MAG: prenyltransferase/squalene oxidase repeat-containing protein [Myxococcota bacterium]|jgi:lanosterol synthase|nr:prenyltransferase/squalene oxidase repeat-containing protein [Myxococcota bacterium]